MGIQPIVSGYNRTRLNPVIQESCVQGKKGAFVVVYIEYEIRYQTLKRKEKQSKGHKKWTSPLRSIISGILTTERCSTSCKTAS